MDLKDHIRSIPDFPKPGIMFRDVTTLFGHAEALKHAVDRLAAPFAGSGIAMVAGIEARGFALAGVLADRLQAGFIPIRKAGKLPHQTVAEGYALEYGEATLEMHMDAVTKGARVLLVDDLIATGGTAIAALSLLRQMGADVVGCGFLIDLPDLGGSNRLRANCDHVITLVDYGGH